MSETVGLYFNKQVFQEITDTCADLGCDVLPLLMASGQSTGKQAVETWEPRGGYSSVVGLALLWLKCSPILYPHTLSV